MTTRAYLLAAALLLSMSAQVRTPGPLGAGMGHLHFHSADAPAMTKFWTDVFGAEPVKVGNLVLYKLPGMFIAIDAATPTAGMPGSTVPSIGLRVRDLAAILDKANARVLERDDSHAVLAGPDDIRIELRSDPSLATAVESGRIAISVPDPGAAEQWYTKTFGAATLPGVRLVFSKASGAVEGTKGRALDHIGLEVRDLREFTRKLAASGQKVDLLYLKLPDSGVAIAFVTDPSGTFIELTEGLSRF